MSIANRAKPKAAKKLSAMEALALAVAEEEAKQQSATKAATSKATAAAKAKKAAKAEKARNKQAKANKAALAKKKAALKKKAAEAEARIQAEADAQTLLELELEMVREPTPDKTGRRLSHRQLTLKFKKGVRDILAPACVMGAPIPVTKLPMFTALWRAHAARAVRSGDVQVAMAASTLLKAIERYEITAARVEVAGTMWAMFMDDKGRVIAAVQPAETYMTGL